MSSMNIIQLLSIIFDALLAFVLSIPAMLAAVFFCVFPRPKKDISKDIVLVTGSGQGLGREMALLFAALCYEVVCVDISADTNEATAKQIIAQGGRARAYVCNVADREAVLKLGRDVGRVDILVNNAGIYPFKSLWNATEAEIRMIIDINLFSQFWTIQAFLPGMKERNHGHLVCISSVSGLMGLGYAIPYSVSKFGIAGLMASLDQEINTEKFNIRTTIVYPYFIKTRPEIDECIQMRIPAVSATYAAKNIVRGVLQNLDSFTVPRSFTTLDNMCRLLPKSYERRILDYFPIKLRAPAKDEFKQQMERDVLKSTGEITAQPINK